MGYNTPYAYDAQDLDAIPELRKRGLHLFLVKSWAKEQRTPAWRGWQTLPVDIDTIYTHIKAGKPIGYLPSSLGLSGIDIDSGNARNIIDSYDNLCYYQTSIESKYHVLFRESNKIFGNPRFEGFLGCSGDIRERGKNGGRGGYLLSWPGSLERIENAMHRHTTTRERIPEIPTEIEEYITRGSSHIDRPYKEAPRALRERALEGIALVGEGRRNITVFEQTWAWARRRRPGTDREKWIKECGDKSVDFALSWVVWTPNFDEKEAARIGEKIGEYIYAKRESYLAMQAARGRKSGKVRSERNAERNARIYDMYTYQGLTQKEISESEGITRRMVSYIIRNHAIQIDGGVCMDGQLSLED